MIRELLNVEHKITGIGSVPHKDAEYICELILEKCPDIPYWPQLTRVDARENMFLQISEKLPCLKPNLEKKNLYYDKSVNKEEKLVEFYQNVIENNYEYFKISKDYARGFYTLLEKEKDRKNQFIKGQVIGPITFLTSIVDDEGRFLIHDDVFSDALVKGLAMKGLWMAKEIKKAGKIPIIFYDEPGLSAFGSAYLPLKQEKAAAMLNELVDFIKERENVLLGSHCCGNTAWEMLLETKIDILSFDSFGYLENFILYPDKIKKFLENNGVIAWGAVPTAEYDKNISLETVYSKLNRGIDTLSKKGIDRELLLRNSLFTPSCGMGGMREEDSERVLDLTMRIINQL